MGRAVNYLEIYRAASGADVRRSEHPVSKNPRRRPTARAVSGLARPFSGSGGPKGSLDPEIALCGRLSSQPITVFRERSMSRTRLAGLDRVDRRGRDQSGRRWPKMTFPHAWVPGSASSASAAAARRRRPAADTQPGHRLSDPANRRPRRAHHRRVE